MWLRPWPVLGPWQVPVVVPGIAGVPLTGTQALIHAPQAPGVWDPAHALVAGAHAPPDHLEAHTAGLGRLLGQR